MRGKIIYWNEEKGYGFIDAGETKDYFFHISSVETGEDSVKLGSLADFEIQKSNGKSQATTIRIHTTSPSIEKIHTPRQRTTKYTSDYSGSYTKLPGSEMIRCLEAVSGWKLEAKLEDAIKYFLPIPEMDLIRSGKKSYIIGRKGTGKTAIVSYLSRVSGTDFSSEKLSFKNFPFNELYRLENHQYTKPNQYITLWKYIIYSTVVRMMADRPQVDPLLQKKIRKVYPEPDASDLKGLLRKWTGGDFSVNILGNGFSFANWFSKNTATSWIERVDHLEEFIKKNCDSTAYLIMFDELGSGFITNR